MSLLMPSMETVSRNLPLQLLEELHVASRLNSQPDMCYLTSVMCNIHTVMRIRRSWDSRTIGTSTYTSVRKSWYLRGIRTSTHEYAREF